MTTCEALTIRPGDVPGLKADQVKRLEYVLRSVLHQLYCPDHGRTTLDELNKALGTDWNLRQAKARTLALLDACDERTTTPNP